MDIADQDLVGKVILEVGSGRGGTTRKLVDLLSHRPGASLIVTDISDIHFQRLREEFRGKQVPIRFICTRAQELEGVAVGSVDRLVCNYTLCAINAEAGQAALALERFREVLKDGGCLLVEEEFPISHARTPRQEVWAEKWRILKTMTLIAGGAPFREFAPVTLAGLCRLVGFHTVEWEAASEEYQGVTALDFLEERVKKLLAEMPNEGLRAGVEQWAFQLREKAERVGGMEVPFYRLTAWK
jgi:SAM-dependent methyltransferase